LISTLMVLGMIFLPSGAKAPVLLSGSFGTETQS